MEHQRGPLLITTIQRHMRHPTQKIGSSFVVRMLPQRKLRLLRKFKIRFIRGPQDQSSWREAARQDLLNRTQISRKSWADRGMLHRVPLR